MLIDPLADRLQEVCSRQLWEGASECGSMIVSATYLCVYWELQGCHREFQSLDCSVCVRRALSLWQLVWSILPPSGVIRKSSLQLPSETFRFGNRKPRALKAACLSPESEDIFSVALDSPLVEHVVLVVPRKGAVSPHEI